MKKIILLIILLFPITVNAISASAYIVMDADSGRVLEGTNIHTEYFIASTTKIMTAVVVLNNTDIKKEIVIGEEVLKSYGSGIYVEVGEKISVENLLYGLMLRSGNDAAIALAHEISDSMEGFAKLMNETSKIIGMENTLFLNSHGLEEANKEGNKSTVYDMGLLSSYAIKNKDYAKITATQKITVKTDFKTYVWNNKNKLLSSYEYCTGGKTGFTQLAKRTLVTNASKDNMNLTVVTFKDPNDFSNHESLYKKYFQSYKSYTLMEEGSIKTKYENTILSSPVRMTLSKSEYKNIKTRINYYDVNVTNIVGEFVVSLNGKDYIKEPIYLASDAKTISKDDFWTKLKRKFGING